MIKIMLVEDEPPILRDIKALIETMDPDFKVVSCAYDGQQAISALQTGTPDIIITDIQIPVIDGLELISYIKNSDLDIFPVILSGYSEFEYAKKALSLGVVDYLLKPVNPKELSKILLNLSLKVHAKKQSQQRDSILRLLDNDGSKVDADSLDNKNSTYLLTLLCAGSFQSYSFDYDSPQKRYWESIDLEKSGNDFLNNSEEIWVFNGKTSAEKIVLFTLDDPSHERTDFLADSFFNYLKASRIPITIAVSPFISKIQEVGTALQSLRYMLCKNTIIGYSQIIMHDKIKEENEIIQHYKCPISNSLIDNMVFSLKQGDIISFKSELRQAFKHLEDTRRPQIFIEKYIRQIILNCRKSISNPPINTKMDLELEISEAIYVSTDYSQLLNNLWYMFEDLFEIRNHDSADLNSTSIIMQKVEEYIKDNMSKPINLQLLSEKFGLVPSYLSRLYKDYKGVSPIEYLTCLRIEKAKELIETQNNLFTKDIASIVGYIDPLHFSKVFKKETGLSPSEYKKKPRV